MPNYAEHNTGPHREPTGEKKERPPKKYLAPGVAGGLGMDGTYMGTVGETGRWLEEWVNFVPCGISGNDDDDNIIG